MNMQRRPGFPAQVDAGRPASRQGGAGAARPAPSAAVAPARGVGLDSAAVRARMVQRLAAAGVADAALLRAMGEVPRHLFVDTALANQAYEETSLPIGWGQTISKPGVVARMIELLLGAPCAQGGAGLGRVLEVGTGCGYQSAILAPLVGQLFTIERIASLQRAAKPRLASLGINNVRFRHGDGFEGWPGQAPFDGILVAAAPGDVPPALVAQLALGGRLVIPVGPAGQQELLRITRTAAGVEREQLSHVSFVPLVGGKG